MKSERRLRPLFTWRTAIVSSDLQHTERLVALVMSLHMSEAGESCFPRLSRLIDETGLSKTTVCRILADLQRKGWLKKQRKGVGRGHATEYTATIPEVIHRQFVNSPASGTISEAKMSHPRDVNVPSTKIKCPASGTNAVYNQDVLEEDVLERANDDFSLLISLVENKGVRCPVEQIHDPKNVAILDELLARSDWREVCDDVIKEHRSVSLSQFARIHLRDHLADLPPDNSTAEGRLRRWLTQQQRS